MIIRKKSWYVHPWGWGSIGINIFLVILARIFPNILGDRAPLGELENSRIQELVVFILYPVVWIIERIFGLARKAFNQGSWLDTIDSIVLVAAVLVYWYFLGMLCWVAKKMLFERSSFIERLLKRN